MFALLLFIVHLNPSMRHSDPFIYFPHYYSEWKRDILATKQLSDTIKNTLQSSSLSSMQYIGSDKEKTVVWVIGESDTKYNWSLYGYKRETNPKIKMLQNELSIFQNIYAAGPNTISSFERMFTPATQKRPNLWKSTPDILLMAKEAGYHIYWISNHTTDSRGLINIFANHADETILTNKGRARGEGSYDEVVLTPYKKALNDDYDKKLIIVHLLGSHPAYDYRYPKEYNHFTYTFDDSVMLELKQKGIYNWALVFRNLYDNSVLYSDMIRYRLLLMLKNSKESKHSSWLYISDHGQDVCHHTNFSGHNFKAKEQWEIPMLFWSSDIKLNKSITNYQYSADVIDHTLLGMMDINGTYYNAEYDLFSDSYNNKNIDSNLLTIQD